jgi:hypothetical protein
LLVDSVESMMMYGLANPKFVKHIYVVRTLRSGVYVNTKGIYQYVTCL